jgi:hypothetical protein
VSLLVGPSACQDIPSLYGIQRFVSQRSRQSGSGPYPEPFDSSPHPWRPIIRKKRKLRVYGLKSSDECFTVITSSERTDVPELSAYTTWSEDVKATLLCSLIWNSNFVHSILRSRYSDWLRAGRPRGRNWSPGRVKNFLFSTSSRPALGPTQPPIQWVPGAFPRG